MKSVSLVFELLLYRARNSSPPSGYTQAPLLSSLRSQVNKGESGTGPICCDIPKTAVGTTAENNQGTQIILILKSSSEQLILVWALTTKLADYVTNTVGVFCFWRKAQIFFQGFDREFVLATLIVERA